VNEFPLVIHAFAADVFVPMVLGPGLLGFLQLPSDAMTPNLRENPAEPVVEHSGFQLKADPEADWLVIHAGNQRERIVAAHETAFEKVHFPLGTKNGIVEIHSLGEHLFIRNINIGLCH
jgi:hypothetical protein